ncbi:MAG: hypothetical protein AVDCRST_MAG18-1801 [uncultured Thermomicrobiales bacterium]|uniref:Uncharacterized protein n=1 Tax=uncultured Thermomicrobiales bacterium TaxID=1645740 RepID=A0A6J4V4N7_9BACT|nr:MAG: hypothetical protein AVDCRST_MAG18-1801 [uncultured Thermomicrobiales bacterium]
MTSLHFAIRYSAERGFEEQALALARRLFAVYDEAIDSLALLPVADDDFTLCVNEAILVSQRRDGRAPTVADVRALLADGRARAESPEDAPPE